MAEAENEKEMLADIDDMIEASKIMAPSGEENVVDNPIRLARIMEFQDVANQKRALAGQFTKKEKEFQTVISDNCDKGIVKDAFTELEAAFNRFHVVHTKYCELAAEIDRSQEVVTADTKFTQVQELLSRDKVLLKRVMDAKVDSVVNENSDSIADLTKRIRNKRSCEDEFNSAMLCLEDDLMDIDKEKVRDGFRAVLESYHRFLECHKLVLAKAHEIKDLVTISAAEEIKLSMESRFQRIREEVTEFVKGKDVWRDVKDYSADKGGNMETKSKRSVSTVRTDRTTDSVRAQRLKNAVEMEMIKTRVQGGEDLKALKLKHLELKQKREREDLEIEMEIQQQASRTELNARIVAERELAKQEAMLTGSADPFVKQEAPAMDAPKVDILGPRRSSKIVGVPDWGSKRLKCTACNAWIREGEDSCHVCGTDLRSGSRKAGGRKVSFEETEKSKVDFDKYDTSHEEDVIIPFSKMVLSDSISVPKPVACSTPKSVIKSATKYEISETKERTHESYLDPVSLMSLEVTRMQQQFVDAIKLPKTEIEPFDGDPLKYHSFIRAFNINIGKSSIDDDEKLDRLIRSCTGSVKLALKPFEMFEPKVGYRSALVELEERYGDPLLITDALEREIESLPFVRNNCVKSLRTYVDKVKVIYNSFVALEAIDEVDTRTKLKLLVAKLPEGLRGRWRKLARGVRHKTLKPPTMRYYIGFITEVLAETSDPQFSEESLGKVKSARSLLTEMGESQPTVIVKEDDEERETGRVMTVQRRNIPCWKCESSDHNLPNCEQFIKMTEQERFDMVISMFLCFNCLKGKQHRGVECYESSNCGVDGCTRKHHRLIHGPATEFVEARKKNQPVERNVHVATRDGSVLCIVPLDLEGPEGLVRTNGIIDSAADSVYMSDVMQERLGVDSEELQVRLNQMVSKDLVDAHKCQLNVHSTYMDYKFKIPEVYAIKDFPEIRNRVAQKADVAGWPHLEGIEFNQCDLEDVHILIGNNVADVFYPLEIRHGEIGEPLAIRNVLGWVVHGQLSRTPDSIEKQVHCIQSNEMLSKQVDKFRETHGPESYVSVKEMSIKDKKEDLPPVRNSLERKKKRKKVKPKTDKDGKDKQMESKPKLAKVDENLNPKPVEVGEETVIEKAICKAPGERSKKPLQRVKIEETGVEDEIEGRKDVIVKPRSTHSQVRHDTKAKAEQTFQKLQTEVSGRLYPTEQNDKPSDKDVASNHSEFSIDLEEQHDGRKEDKNGVSSLPETTASCAISGTSPRIPEVPKTSYQFQTDWKIQKNHTDKFHQYFTGRYVWLCFIIVMLFHYFMDMQTHFS